MSAVSKSLGQSNKPRLKRSDDLNYRDPDYIAQKLKLMLRLCRAYFRAEVRGLDNIPTGRGSLLVGNHSGGFHIMDSMVFTAELYGHFGPQFRFHQLIHDAVSHLPGYDFARKLGAITATPENATAALRRGAALLVYPGGDHESFRPFWEANKITFDGRKGFIKLALAEGVPIVPVVSIGGQETALFLTRGKRLARLFGFDRKFRLNVFSISLGFPFGLSVMDFPPRLPLPSKITIQVLPAIDLRQRFGEEPNLDEVYEAITGEMQQALDKLASERRFPVIG